MGSNGNSPVVKFPTGVPIVGQPFTLKNFFVTVQIVCNCEGKEPVLLVGNGIGTCPGCRRGFQLQGIQSNPRGLEFRIGLITPQASAAPAPEPPAAS